LVTVAALLTWLLTASVGGYLLRTWLVNGGWRTRRQAEGSRFAPGLIFGHGGLAATGLVLWLVFLATGADPFAWLTLGVLLPVAVLGFTMFGLWLRAGHGKPRGRHAYTPRHAAEDHFPPPAVLGHGVFAVATVVLVLFTTILSG